MGKFIDLTGQTFGRLKVIQKTTKAGNEWQWLCECKCGKQCIVRGVNLRTGTTKSCGCLKQESDKKTKNNVIDLTGQIFNHLTVLKRDGSDKRGEAKWLCECDCPQKTQISVLSSNLRSGHTTSCGCERRSHGEQKIIQLLTESNITFEVEKSMFKYNNGYPAKFDFYVNNKYLIEYDGETHYQYNLHGWHTKDQLEKQLEYDTIKTEWCKNNNIPLIRIPYFTLNELSIEDLLLETTKYKV